MITTLALAGAATATTALLVLVGLRRWAPRLGLMDLPNARSSHRSPRPRGGGVAIVAGLLAGLAVLTALGAGLSSRAGVVLGAALAIALVGLWDDVARLGALARLAVHFAAAAAVVTALGGLARLPLPPPADLELAGVAGAALALLWLAGVTNFFNFMDGIDGLAAGQALVTSLALIAAGAAAEAARPAGLLAVALLVFLCFNWAPARVFLGDAGSGFLGFLLAALPWLGPEEARARNLLLVALSLSLFLGDPLWTLAARWRRGARLAEPHREHLYQRLASAERGHGRVAGGLLAAAALLAALGVWSFGVGPRGWLAIGVALLLFLVELRLARR